MRKATFIFGFAIGFIAGTRAGRERYEQMVSLGRQAANHPAVQRATQTAGAKASEYSKVASQKASERMPKLTETAKSSATRVRDRMGSQRDSGGQSAVDGTSPDGPGAPA
ncbi:MAG: hypothetical protein JO132_07615 [Streptosporangiaceae bacterium]|nr:hypothetical protein [Streptosporangiaceae bacterium]